jgi:hypothetical protein
LGSVDDVLADRVVDLGQRGEVEVRAQELDQRQPLLGQQGFKKVAELRLVQLADVRFSAIVSRSAIAAPICARKEARTTPSSP